MMVWKAPRVGDERDQHRVDGADAEADQQRRGDRDRGSEAGNTLEERREHPTDGEHQEQLVSAELHEALAEGIEAARTQRHQVEQERGPHDVEDEHGIPDPLAGGHGQCTDRRAVRQQADGRGGEDGRRPGLDALPVKPDQ